MKRWLALLLLLACHRQEASQPDAATPAPPPPLSLWPDAGEPRVLVADLYWAFWTHDGDLVAASRSHLYPVAPGACAVSSSVALDITGVVAKNGLDHFVVTRASSAELWDAKSLTTIASLPHHERGTRGGAIDSAHIALPGCEKMKADANGVSRCGELYDATSGARVADLVATHPLERVDFSDNGKYLVGRSDDAGLTVFDAATGKVIATRPHWKKLLEVHAWNRPDLAEIAGDTLIVGYDETIEHIDLTTGKSLGKIVIPGKTMATFGPRTGRIAVMSGADNRVTVLDSRVVRKFDLRRYVKRGADCTHCALEFDAVDEDVVWLTSAYTDDRLQLTIGSGAVEREKEHELRSDSVPSATHRLQSGRETCSLVSRTADRPVPTFFCNFLDAHGRDWPYPGFSPDGRYLAAVNDGALHVMPVDGAECVIAK